MEGKKATKTQAERIDLRLQPWLRERLRELAEREKCGLSEIAVRLICRALHVKEDRGLMPREKPGRKPAALGGQKT
jgi:hypothetical protein